MSAYLFASCPIIPFFFFFIALSVIRTLKLQTGGGKQACNESVKLLVLVVVKPLSELKLLYSSLGDNINMN